MQARQDIGLLACSGIVALVVLGVIVDAPLTPTLYITGAFIILALTIRFFTSKREARQEKYEIEQKKSRSRLTIWCEVIDAMPNACVLIDKDKRVIYANESARSLATIETLGRPFTSYIRGIDMTLALDRALLGKTTDVVDIHKFTPTEQYLRVELTQDSHRVSFRVYRNLTASCQK